MGGVMSYTRLRGRNGLNSRSGYGEGSYAPPSANLKPAMLIGDLNRMERDVLGLGPCDDEWLDEAAVKTGITKEILRRAYRHLFEEGQTAYGMGPVQVERITIEEEHLP